MANDISCEVESDCLFGESIDDPADRRKVVPTVNDDSVGAAFWERHCSTAFEEVYTGKSKFIERHSANGLSPFGDLVLLEVDRLHHQQPVFWGLLVHAVVLFFQFPHLPNDLAQESTEGLSLESHWMEAELLLVLPLLPEGPLCGHIIAPNVDTIAEDAFFSLPAEHVFLFVGSLPLE